MNRFFLFLSLITASFFIKAQSVYAPLSTNYNHTIDRLEILSGQVLPDLHTSFKPYLRRDIVQSAVKDYKLLENIFSPVDLENITYLTHDSPEESGLYGKEYKLFKTFYKQKNAFYHVKVPDFELFLNPVLGFSSGTETNNKNLLYQNTRGIELRGKLANKVGFYSFIGENQLTVPNYIKSDIDTFGVLPGAGFIKNFKNNGYDFFQARGYITFQPLKITTLQFGHDRNFIGNGFRSLIWSDNSRESLFLKLQTKVWKFNYTNLFTELTDLIRITGSGTGIAKKYAAVHHLSLNLGKKLNIGLYESVLFERKNAGFEINYLNPIIFYRAVEHNLNSSDNVLVGMDIKYLPIKNVCLYGQLILDEFVKDQLVKRTGWWANKWGIQAGLKYLNVLNVKNLDLQLEYNMVRPFTYTHYNRSQNYIHYNQAIAHPLGANFKEILAVVRYQPIYVLRFELTAIMYNRGLDSSTLSNTNGGNILRDYNNRIKETGNTIGQGISNQVIFLQLLTTYQPWHNLNIDLRLINRATKSPIVTNELIATIGLRLNLFWSTPFSYQY
jgi:hypothetical protein